MSNSKMTTQTFVAAALGLGMALGPLTALSLGSRYAGESTWERAYSGTEPTASGVSYAQYDIGLQSPPSARSKDLADIVAGAGMFTTFQSAMSEAGLDEVLTGDTAYTVFLPTNEAFARMIAVPGAPAMRDPDQLRELLESHIVKGRVGATDLLQVSSLSAINGKEIPIRVAGSPMAGSAKVVKTDVASNGMVHIVDAVL